jgi:hypothetical protein
MKSRHASRNRWQRIALALAVAVGLAGCRPSSNAPAGASAIEPVVVKEIPTQQAPTATLPLATLPLATAPPPTVPPATVPAGDPLVYLDAIALQPSSDGQAYFEGIWEGDLQGVPLRAPDGATAAFSYTHDTLEQVQSHFEAALAADDWEPVRQGIGMNAWGYLWKKGDANLIVLLITNFTEEHLPWFADTFDLQLPDTKVVLISTYAWEAE